MPIQGLSQIRRLPRLGVIKLGKKNERNLPVALDYFLCPGEVQEVYGEKPTVLDIRFPLDRPGDIFPQFYKLYGQSAGLKAYSDGVTIWTRGMNPGEWEESPAPSKEKLEAEGFRAMGTLQFILPKVSRAGVYHIVTRSFHSIVKLNSCIDYIRATFGRISFLPLKLVLEPTEAHINIGGKPAKKTVYTMRLDFDEQGIMAFMKQRKEALQQMNQTPVLEPSKPQLEPIAEEEEDEEDEDLNPENINPFK